MSGGGPPGPISNPAVKPASAHGSMRFAACESRPSPTHSLPLLPPLPRFPSASLDRFPGCLFALPRALAPRPSPLAPRPSPLAPRPITDYLTYKWNLSTLSATSFANSTALRGLYWVCAIHSVLPYRLFPPTIRFILLTRALAALCVVAALVVAGPAARAQDDTPGVHVVQPGETLSEIAKQYGVAEDLLREANGIDDPNAISEGQALRIPFATPQPTSAPGTHRVQTR